MLCDKIRKWADCLSDSQVQEEVNKKQKASTANTDIFPQYFMKLLEDFNYLPCLSYKKRQVKMNLLKNEDLRSESN